MASSETDSGCPGGEEGESFVKLCVLEGFSDSSETKALIASLPEVHGDMVTSERATEKFLGETGIHRQHEA